MDSPIVLRPGDGEQIGTNMIKAARSELSLLELEIRPGSGVDSHCHDIFDI